MKVNDLPVDTFGEKPKIQEKQKEQEQKDRSKKERGNHGKKMVGERKEKEIVSDSESEKDIILVKYGEIHRKNKLYLKKPSQK